MLFKEVRRRLDALLAAKLSQPGLDIHATPEGRELVSIIRTLIATEELM